LFVNYADVLEAPREEAARINAFLGRQLDVERMVSVVQPALYRIRRSPTHS
jgi:hypothetical protein